MKNQLLNILKKLSKRDLDLLHHLYLYRCLTFQQAKDFIYKENEISFESFVETFIYPLLSLEVVEEVEYLPNKYVLFLTTNGVDIVRQTKDIPLEIFNPDTKIVKRGYYRAGELKMQERLVNHQVFLNQFVLEFEELAGKCNMKWKYYDEKYVSQYFTIRPDGLIQLLDTDFFLEMDMGTESKKQLEEKWNHYRDFIRSSEFRNKERKIMILFITENVKNLEARKELIRFTAANQILDLFQDSFDMVIGSKNELLQMLFQTILPNILQVDKKRKTLFHLLQNKHQFQIDYALPLKFALNDADYEYYIRKINEDKRIVTENGKLQEYVLDVYIHQPLSVLQRIQFHQKNSNVFQLKFKRPISYIVIGKDEKSLFQDLKIADAINVDKVYFTTLKRLKNLPFHEALFQFDPEGNIYHFLDTGLSKRVLEQSS